MSTRLVPAAMAVVVALLVGMGVGIGGCAGAGADRVKLQGRSGLAAVYEGGWVSVTAPDTVRVGGAIAAAESVLRARGYSIDRSEATEEGGRVVALPPRSGGSPRVVVMSERTGAGVVIRVKREPFGDEQVSRSVMDGVLKALGL